MSLEEEDVAGLEQEEEFNLEDYLRFSRQLDEEDKRKPSTLEQEYQWNSDDSEEEEEESEIEYDTVVNKRRSQPYQTRGLRK